jgi:hypothetical protein
MRNNPPTKLVSQFSTFLAFAAASILAPLVTYAAESAREVATPSALFAPKETEIFVTVRPMVGTPGQPTKTGCGPFKVVLDTSEMESRSLVVGRTAYVEGYFCLPLSGLLMRAAIEFTPTKAGALQVRWEGGAEVTIQTVALLAASKFETNGMWFDPSTNGSGVSLHHRRATSDAAFGTWFLFDSNGVSRWYTLQSASWQQDGTVLDGLLYRTEGNCVTVGLAACPATGTVRTPQDGFWEIPSRARITFQSSTRARAEVLSLGGVVLFTSDLTKLQF